MPKRRTRSGGAVVKREPVSYTAPEVLALMNACSRGPTGRRNRALIVLLWRGGLRVGEALALRPGDLDPKRCLVRIARGKGGRARTIALDMWAWETLDLWSAARADLLGRRAAPYLCTVKGGRLHTSYVRAALQRLGQHAGIEKRVHPHGLRHTCALELSREGVALPTIRDQMGHASVATTDHYLRAHSPVEIERLALARRGPDVDAT